MARTVPGTDLRKSGAHLSPRSSTASKEEGAGVDDDAKTIGGESAHGSRREGRRRSAATLLGLGDPHAEGEDAGDTKAKRSRKGKDEDPEKNNRSVAYLIEHAAEFIVLFPLVMALRFSIRAKVFLFKAV